MAPELQNATGLSIRHVTVARKSDGASFRRTGAARAPSGSSYRRRSGRTLALRQILPCARRLEEIVRSARTTHG